MPAKLLTFLCYCVLQWRVRVFFVEGSNDPLRSRPTRIVAHLDAVTFGIDFSVLDTFDFQHALRNDAKSLTTACADRTFLLKSQQNIRAVLFCRLGLCLAEDSRCKQQSDERSHSRMLSRIHNCSPFVFSQFRPLASSAQLTGQQRQTT